MTESGAAMSERVLEVARSYEGVNEAGSLEIVCAHCGSIVLDLSDEGQFTVETLSAAECDCDTHGGVRPHQADDLSVEAVWRRENKV